MKIYGLFECSCGRTWTNLKAEEGVTQECNDCHDNVRPQKAMFGRFECGCGNVWRSRRAVEGSTQECRGCRKNVESSNLQEVRQFGRFECSNIKCLHEWASASAWVGYKQGCTECGEYTLPYQLTRLLRKSGNKEDSEVKPHMSALCEKCQELGHNCVTLERL